MKIIDAHHHYWNPVANDHPWLTPGQHIPFRYGDYSAICKPFLPEDYRQVSANWNVIATITMEGEWNPDDPLGETHWMQQLHYDSGKPAAHVAQAWLDRADITTVLANLDDMPFVKSVRHKPVSNSKPGGPAGGMTSHAFINGFKRMAEHRLHFDLQTPWWHLDEALAMAAHSPDTAIILNHTGLPADRSAEGISNWSKAMQRFASLEQAWVKISGLGLAGKPWHINDNREIVLRTIDCFGTDRCLFASNFPVDGLCGSFDTIYSGYSTATSDFSETERQALFSENANRLYQLGLDTSP